MTKTVAETVGSFMMFVRFPIYVDHMLLNQ